MPLFKKKSAISRHSSQNTLLTFHCQLRQSPLVVNRNGTFEFRRRTASHLVYVPMACGNRYGSKTLEGFPVSEELAPYHKLTPIGEPVSKINPSEPTGCVIAAIQHVFSPPIGPSHRLDDSQGVTINHKSLRRSKPIVCTRPIHVLHQMYVETFVVMIRRVYGQTSTEIYRTLVMFSTICFIVVRWTMATVVAGGDFPTPSVVPSVWPSFLNLMVSFLSANLCHLHTKVYRDTGHGTILLGRNRFVHRSQWFFRR